MCEFFEGPLYGVFEVMQYTNVLFVVSRWLKAGINYEKDGHKQMAPYVIIAISAISAYFTITQLCDLYDGSFLQHPLSQYA